MAWTDDWLHRTPWGNMVNYSTDGNIDKVIIALIESHCAKALTED